MPEPGEILSGDDLFSSDPLSMEELAAQNEGAAPATAEKSKLDPPVETEPPAQEGAGEGAQDDPPAPPVQAGEPEEPEVEKPAAPAPGEGEDLTGIEKFLSNYGVQGGIIKFEDGKTAKFQDLEEDVKAEVLLSLTKNAVPTIEEKYNLSEKEIDFLNEVRGSGTTTEEYINNLINYRLDSLLASKEANNQDYESLSADAVFVKHVREADPEMDNEAIAKELEAAKSLATYESTVQTIRDNYIKGQQKNIREQEESDTKSFNTELESQRKEVVREIEGMTSIAGAPITDEIKEFLLTDMMEVNDSKDPLLMEKIFSDPQKMFKANWFLNYGEEYMERKDSYWKDKVSKAVKKGYDMAVNGMPEDAVVSGVVGNRRYTKPADGSMISPELGRVITEDELFDDID